MASKEPVICSVANNKNLFTTLSAELSIVFCYKY
jgi:hypothetical protein